MIAEALRWHSLGISCVPFWQYNKGWDKDVSIKRGFNELSDFTRKLPSEEDLKYWFNSRRKLAVMTKPNFICVDFDSWYSHYCFCALHPELTKTFTVKTKRGCHLYYFLNEPIDKDIKVDKEAWPKVDLKHTGKTAITHGSGYQIVNDRLPLKLDNIFVLPFVQEVKKSVSPSNKKTSFVTRCQMSGDPIQRIKENLPISQYLADLGYPVKRTGEGKYITLCPFHDDEKCPSYWIVEPISNCFACEFENHLDVLDLHQRLNRCTLNEAIYRLASRLGF